MSAQHAVKITLDAETRRFPAGSLPLHSLDEVRARLASEFPSATSGGYALRYTDEEGDLVTVRSQAEWEEALNCLRLSNKVPRFTLAPNCDDNESESAGHGSLPPFFSFMGDILAEVQKEAESRKDAGQPTENAPTHPTPQPHHLPFPFGRFPIHIALNQPSAPPASENEGQNEQEQEQEPGNERVMFVRRGPRCGAGRSLNIGAERANCRAVHLMRAQDYKGAAALLEKAAARWPDHANTRYNLACTLALTGECDAAMGFLAHSLDLGFANTALLATDPDLDSLRTRPDFIQLVGDRTGKENGGDQQESESAEPTAQPAPAPKPTRIPLPHLIHPIFGQRCSKPSLFCHAMPVPGAACQSPHSPKQPEQQPEVEPEDEQPIITCPDASTKSFMMSSHPFKEDPATEVVVDVVEEEDWSDSSSSHASQQPDEEAPFQYAREFAEVREIGIPVPDTVLRSLLEAHNGDVRAVMSELCTTPR